MNSVQIHLALTHVPVILSLTGLVMLAIAWMKRNTMLVKTSYVILLIAGITALPVYLSGEPAEEAVEKLPGIAESIMENHEEVAQMAMISIAVCGLAALTALFLRKPAFAGLMKPLTLLLAVISGGLMFQTAQLGGKIRHSEIRGEITQAIPSTGTANEGWGNQPQENSNQEEDHD